MGKSWYVNYTLSNDPYPNNEMSPIPTPEMSGYPLNTLGGNTWVLHLYICCSTFSKVFFYQLSHQICS